jgi:NADH:ubiquinone oxidoreductase subunit E
MSSSPAADRERSVSAVVQPYRRDPLILLQILQEVQNLHAYVSDDAISHMAREPGVARGQIEGTVESYAFLSPRPPRLRFSLFVSFVT